jgi:hypothetical protein
MAWEATNGKTGKVIARGETLQQCAARAERFREKQQRFTRVDFDVAEFETFAEDDQVDDAVAQDRDEMLRQLLDLGFDLDALKNAPTETLGEILRVLSDAPEDEEYEEDEDEEDEPSPETFADPENASDSERLKIGSNTLGQHFPSRDANGAPLRQFSESERRRRVQTAKRWCKKNASVLPLTGTTVRDHVQAALSDDGQYERYAEDLGQKVHVHRSAMKPTPTVHRFTERHAEQGREIYRQNRKILEQLGQSEEQFLQGYRSSVEHGGFGK